VTSPPATYRGTGGAVTARITGGVLQLVSSQAAPGYVVTEQKADATEIEVRFEGLAGRTRIVLRLENGRISPEIDENPTTEGSGGASDQGSPDGSSSDQSSPSGSNDQGGGGHGSGDGASGRGGDDRGS
jgi:hypothetical protein